MLFKPQHASATALPPDIFSALAPQDLTDLLALAEQRHYPKGSAIFRAGDPGRHVYFLQSGRAKIYQLAPNGKEVILWYCFAGEMCGLAEVARGGGRSVSAVACSETDALKLNHDVFNDFLVHHPQASFLMIQMLACRLRGLGDMLVNLVSDDVTTRVAKLILRLAARYGRRDDDEVILDIHLTHQEMADMIGTSRQTLTGVLNDLKRQGILNICNRTIRIESEKSLDALSRSAAA